MSAPFNEGRYGLDKRVDGWSGAIPINCILWREWVSQAQTHPASLLELRSFSSCEKQTVLTIKPAQVICPSGCLSNGASSCFSDFPKNISVFTHPKSILELSHPTPPEGRIMIVTDAGRDAVDAAASGAQRGCRAGHANGL